jgi:hypothetical protein
MMGEGPEFGFPPVTVDVGPAAGRLGDHTELQAAACASRTPSDASRVASDSFPAASVSSSQAADVGLIRRRRSSRASADSHGRSLDLMP